MSKKEDTAGIIADLMAPFLESSGLEIYRTEFKKEGPAWVLRVVLDKPADADPEYVSITECEEATRFLSDRLDETDFTDRSYNLEVCSPGLDRELIKDSDFTRFAGREVEVKTYEQIDGSKEHTGTLISKENGEVSIETESGKLVIPAEKISRINLTVIF